MDVEHFRKQELAWSHQLRGLALVSEAGFDVDESVAALQFVVRSYRYHQHSREARIGLLRRYPASLLAGLTAVASTRYDEGTFWPRVSEVADTDMNQVRQTELSDGFRYGLDEFELSRFDTPLRNIGEILMHAGIPVSSLAGFLRLLGNHDRTRHDLTGEDFCGWVAGMTRLRASTKGLDAPTWRFLSEGGEVAADLIDRFLSFLDAAATNSIERVDVSLHVLPQQLADEARRLIQVGEVRSAPTRSRSRRRDRVPHIVYADGLAKCGCRHWRWRSTGT